MPLRAHIAALVLAVVSGPALAADLVGYSEAFDTLYRVDLTTQSAQEIGRATPLGFPRFSIIVGLTFSPDGHLFAVSSGNNVKSLLQINPHTGLATAVGTLNLGTNQQLDLGLAFTCDGTLWMSSGTGNLWRVNPADATVIEVGTLGVKITGLAAQGNLLYGAGSQENNNLYSIDQSTGQTNLIGAYGSGVSYVSIASPAFDGDGKLWTILDYIPLPRTRWSDLAQNNIVSGALTNLGSITAQGSSVNDLEFIGLRGLAIVPPICGASQAVDPTPTMSSRGLALLIALVMLLAVIHLRD